MVLGRIIILTGGQELSLVRVTWLTKIFVTGDVLSFLIQGAGGGMLASAKTKSVTDRGELFVKIGLIIQVLFFGLFILVSIHYSWRLHKHPTEASHITPISWAAYLRILYFTSLLIMIRSIFRLIEYLQGRNGELLSHEMYLFIFDAALMFLAMIAFNWKHPSTLIPSNLKGNTQDIETDSDNILMQERERMQER
ncbi:putative rta1 domain protein [Neofusicoccum parvum UCRNP2]|uniref:Putative rta1 domain protein n=1 Tax=Botryosphaeria parva (strain UCR-NP2) TaxID=1287680 RepID=R1GM56_BOTPV|nr:putative rta1 domain protein [Neofusicoccum parvum UCRNP2]